MKKRFLPIAMIALTAVFVAACGQSTDSTPNDPAPTTPGGNGFNTYGYNYTASLFNGAADGVDKSLDGMVWGDATYANDHLVMNWNAEWDRGNDEGWTDDYYAAWTTNHWNGNVPGGSGEVWHYKIIWVGPELEDSPYWVDGGYPIWGRFEAVMDQGTVANEHFWYAHATPNGLIFPN
jgi:hypothetical protein